MGRAENLDRRSFFKVENPHFSVFEAADDKKRWWWESTNCPNKTEHEIYDIDEMFYFPNTELMILDIETLVKQAEEIGGLTSVSSKCCSIFFLDH